MDNIELGNNLIALGNLIKNDNSKLSDIVSAARICGMTYSFRLESNEEGTEIKEG